MAELFQRNKSTISRHIKNIFESGELQRNSVVAFSATTAADGKTYAVSYYNLDMIISVGYRVKNEYLTAMRESVVDPTLIKTLLKGALTDRINDREMFMKDIDYSYYYEKE